MTSRGRKRRLEVLWAVANGPLWRTRHPQLPAALIVIAALALSSLTTTADATNAVGRLDGQYAVNATGAATYTVPIDLPKGAGGLTPTLSLVYDSQAGNGLLGVGWTLDGISSITRCPDTVEEDGEAEPVNLVPSDRFCLDGQKLRLNSGTYGVDGATYYAEINHYDLVTSHDTAGSGPLYFTLQTPDGSIYEYGNTADSIEIDSSAGAIVRWMIDKITDAAGNTVTFAYSSAGNTNAIYPTTVTYAGIGGTDVHTVTFSYASRPDPIVTFAGGIEEIENKELTGVSVAYDGSTLLNWVLSYASGASPSRLASIDECAGSSCYPATTFAWQTASWAGMSGAVAFNADASAGLASPLSDEMYAHLADVNGDGCSDLIYPGTSTWMVALGNCGSSGAGFKTPVDTGISDDNYQQTFIIDYNDDGKADFMQPDANGDWLVFESKVSGSTLTFSATQTGIADNAYEDNDEIADVNGDGRGDLVYATAPSSGEVNWYYRPNNGGSFGAPVPMFTDSDSTLLERTGATVNVSTRALGAAPDINGDHRTDLMLLSTNTVQPTCNTDGCTPPPPYDTYTWRMIPSGGFAGELSLSDSNNNAGIEDKSEPIFVDLNGDGMTDVAWDEPPDTNPTDSNPADWTWHIWLATGTGFTYAGDTGKLAPTPYAAIAIDYNHDGREDILYPDFAAGVWKVLLSTGNGLAGPYSTGIATHSDNQDYGVGAADVNGDGLPDFIVSENGSYEYAMHKGAMPHLLSGITDGFGNSITMQYAALPQTSAYTAATAPIGIYNESFAGALYVVTKDINSDGISGTYTRTYSYTGAAGLRLSGVRNEQCDRQP